MKIHAVNFNVIARVPFTGFCHNVINAEVGRIQIYPTYIQQNLKSKNNN